MATEIINKFGTMQGWNSVKVNLLGRDVIGITAIKYDDTLTKENVYGAGKFPIGRSQGNYAATASITLLKEEADALRRSVPPGKRLQDIGAFDIPVVYEYDGPLGGDVIRNCEFTNNGVDVKQADGTIATEFTLITSHIDWNAAA